jgi:phage terminase large subunit-like protein
VGDVERFEVKELANDPAQLTQFAGELSAEGLTMVEMRPTVLNFSPAMKELETLVYQGHFRYNCPVLEWMIANVVCHRDNKDNIYPRKENPESKIDGAIAIFMALARTMVVNPAPEKSFWEAETA